MIDDSVVHATKNIVSFRYGTIDNVTYAANVLKVHRIGHGIAIGRYEGVLKALSESKNVAIEVCLTSNVARGYKVSSYAVHPVRKFYENRLPFSLRFNEYCFSYGDIYESLLF